MKDRNHVTSYEKGPGTLFVVIRRDLLVAIINMHNNNDNNNNNNNSRQELLISNENNNRQPWRSSPIINHYNQLNPKNTKLAKASSKESLSCKCDRKTKNQ